jgi:hypothetical protein
MSKLETLENAVKALPAADFARFREWFLQFDAEAWDRQIAADLTAGRLDGLIADALGELKSGRTRDL